MARRRRAVPESAEQAEARAEFKRQAKNRNAATPESPAEARRRAELKAARLAAVRPPAGRSRTPWAPPLKLYRVCHPRLRYGKKGDVVELPETGATLILVQNGSLELVTKKAAVVEAEPEKEANDG